VPKESKHFDSSGILSRRSGKKIKFLPEGLECWKNLLYGILATNKEKNNSVNPVSLQATRVREKY
jgi:hypothetical protein